VAASGDDGGLKGLQAGKLQVACLQEDRPNESHFVEYLPSPPIRSKRVTGCDGSALVSIAVIAMFIVFFLPKFIFVRLASHVGWLLVAPPCMKKLQEVYLDRNACPVVLLVVQEKSVMTLLLFVCILLPVENVVSHIERSSYLNKPSTIEFALKPSSHLCQTGSHLIQPEVPEDVTHDAHRCRPFSRLLPRGSPSLRNDSLSFPENESPILLFATDSPLHENVDWIRYTEDGVYVGGDSDDMDVCSAR
jgi:hypothetical protein